MEYGNAGTVAINLLVGPILRNIAVRQLRRLTTMYKCIRCGRQLEKSFGTTDIECECGSRVFIKERPSIEKVVKAR